MIYIVILACSAMHVFFPSQLLTINVAVSTKSNNIMHAVFTPSLTYAMECIFSILYINITEDTMGD